MKHKDSFGERTWEDAARHFQKSGEIIEEIVNGFLEDVAGHFFRNPEKYIPLFQELRGCEEIAFRKILGPMSKKSTS